jgi:hypothetical protein
MSYHLTNIDPTPVLGELVAIAAKRTGFDIEYRLGGQTYGEMDWVDAAEAHDAGYRPDPSTGALFLNGPMVEDLGPFWNELERLSALIVKPLDEPILDADYPIYGGFWYVVDGKPQQCEYFNGESNRGITVAECKRRFGIGEIRRCDIVGRQQRAAVQPNRTQWDRNFCTQMQDDPTIAATFTKPGHWRPNGRTIQQAYRRPRCSNKIKKVK